MLMKLQKIMSFCLLIFSLGQTACTPSYYKIVKSDPLPASGRGNITGTVLSETDGQPLENVEILLCRDFIGISTFATCSKQIGQTKTNQDGVYWFRNLPPGSYVPAIRQSENSFYVLQEKKEGAHLIKAVSFNLEAGQTIQIAPQKIGGEAQINKKSEIKLTFPTNFETIRERKPKLTWEAIAKADSYYPFWFYW